MAWASASVGYYKKARHGTLRYSGIRHNRRIYPAGRGEGRGAALLVMARLRQGMAGPLTSGSYRPFIVIRDEREIYAAGRNLEGKVIGDRRRHRARAHVTLHYSSSEAAAASVSV